MGLNHSTKKLTTEQFIEKSKKVHEDKYDYSLVNYINLKTKIDIICPTHGIFEQSPNNHLKYGCKFCGGTQKMTNEDFIEKSNIIHNYFYNYSKTMYIKSSEKVTIICPIHGDFQQSANSHLSGSDCYECGKSKREGRYNRKNAEKYKEVYLTTPAVVYVGEMVDKNGTIFIKLGVSKNINNRVSKYQNNFTLLKLIDTNLYDAIYLEDEISEKFKEYKYTPYYFKGYTECLEEIVKNEIINYLNEYK